MGLGLAPAHPDDRPVHQPRRRLADGAVVRVPVVVHVGRVHEP